MNLSNIGIIGSRGRLGQELVKRGCLPLEFDVIKPFAIESNKLDVLVNCVGFTDVDECENQIFKAYKVNAFAPRRLRLAWPKDKLFVHISSDYIFDGINGPYGEDARACPLGTYGFSKWLGEVGLQDLENVLIIRTTILYDTGPKNNFVLSVYNDLKNNKSTRAPKILSGSPTYIQHLVDGILNAIEKRINGIINIAGSTVCSRYELALFVSKAFGFDSTLVDDNPTWGIARRPMNAGLRVDKAVSLKIPIYDLYDGLQAFKKVIITNE